MKPTRSTIFLSCPMDLRAEKRVLREVIDRFRPKFSNLGVMLETLTCENDTNPDVARGSEGGPQHVVERQMVASRQFDLYVGVFRDRVGEGTRREFEIARRRAIESTTGLPEVFFYLVTDSGCIHEDVLEFERAFPGLLCEVDGLGGLESQFSHHLVDHLLSLYRGAPQLASLLQERSWIPGLRALAPVPSEKADKPDPGGLYLSRLRAVVGRHLKECSDSEIEALIASCYAAEVALTGDPKTACQLCESSLRDTRVAGATREVISLACSEKVIQDPRPVIDECRCGMLAALVRLGLLLTVDRLPWRIKPLAGHKGLAVLQRLIRGIDLRRGRADDTLGDGAPQFVVQVRVNREAGAQDERLAQDVARRFFGLVWKQVVTVLRALPPPVVELQREITAPKLMPPEREQLEALHAALVGMHMKFTIRHFGDSGPVPETADLLPLPCSTIAGPALILLRSAGRYRLVVDMPGSEMDALGFWVEDRELRLVPHHA